MAQLDPFLAKNEMPLPLAQLYDRLPSPLPKERLMAWLALLEGACRYITLILLADAAAQGAPRGELKQYASVSTFGAFLGAIQHFVNKRPATQGRVFGELDAFVGSASWATLDAVKDLRNANAHWRMSESQDAAAHELRTREEAFQQALYDLAFLRRYALGSIQSAKVTLDGRVEAHWYAARGLSLRSGEVLLPDVGQVPTEQLVVVDPTARRALTVAPWLVVIDNCLLWHDPFDPTRETRPPYAGPVPGSAVPRSAPMGLFDPNREFPGGFTLDAWLDAPKKWCRYTPFPDKHGALERIIDRTRATQVGASAPDPRWGEHAFAATQPVASLPWPTPPPPAAQPVATQRPPDAFPVPFPATAAWNGPPAAPPPLAPPPSMPSAAPPWQTPYAPPQTPYTPPAPAPAPFGAHPTARPTATAVPKLAIAAAVVGVAGALGGFAHLLSARGDVSPASLSATPTSATLIETLPSQRELASLDAWPALAPSLHRWEHAVLAYQDGGDIGELRAVYAGQVKFRGSANAFRSSEWIADYWHQFFQRNGGSLRVDWSRTQWRVEALDPAVDEQRACATVPGAADGVLLVRLSVDENDPTRPMRSGPALPCPRLRGIYMLRLRAIPGIGLRVCHEGWSRCEGLCAPDSCPQAPVCRGC